MNRRLLRLVLIFIPVFSAAAQSTLEIVEPNQAAVLRPGQTVVVAVRAAGTYSNVWLVGDEAIKVMQMLTSQPYRFSLTIPENIGAGRYSLRAMGCRRPGDCDEIDPITIDV